MTDFAFYDAAKLEKALGQRDALAKALEEIAAMDPKGIRADDLGRAARIASKAIRRDVSAHPQEIGDQP
jgi:NADH/NAD ratio-sensing transcriptional regulator Rex